MTRRHLLHALASLPLVGPLAAKLAPKPTPNPLQNDLDALASIKNDLHAINHSPLHTGYSTSPNVASLQIQAALGLHHQPNLSAIQHLLGIPK